jgi:hypothetical protein
MIGGTASDHFQDQTIGGDSLPCGDHFLQRTSWKSGEIPALIIRLFALLIIAKFEKPRN